MIDPEWAQRFAEEWIAAWNSHDLERILSHYADDFEMRSPLIVARMKEPSGRLAGKDAVGAYWRDGLAASPDLHFELTDVLIGASGVTICYKNHRSQRVAEVLLFDDQGKAVSGNAHYAG